MNPTNISNIINDFFFLLQFQRADIPLDNFRGSFKQNIVPKMFYNVPITNQKILGLGSEVITQQSSINL